MIVLDETKQRNNKQIHNLRFFRIFEVIFEKTVKNQVN
jgi:uncharacterized DUF497 family protein